VAQREIELHDSYTGQLTTENGKTVRTISRRVLISEQWSYAAAESYAEGLMPINWQTHTRQSLDVKPLGDGWWEIAASYKQPNIENEDPENDDNQQAVSNSLSWDTTGGTEHVYQAYYNGAAEWGGEAGFAKDEFPPQFYGAINCSGGSVQGVDKVVPQFNFTESWTWPQEYVTDEYVSLLHNLTGTINSKKFRIFDAGECLFMGARADRNRNDNKITITYSFRAIPNRENFKVGQVTVSKKEGWQYMWVVYEDKESSGSLVKRPRFVFVNDIYEKTDFGQLSIGTNFASLSPPIVPQAQGEFGGGQPQP
jgi:hypothetical protein